MRRFSVLLLGIAAELLLSAERETERAIDASLAPFIH